ncbi:GntR family transcriptional regulator [Streptomyces griseorubiginosus]|uniref:winged helix-turn-helix domain-containing protein n=1 Tax=Streptomyces griseorubiginosus TaxID=67304 RepID=UPI0036F0CF87
MEDVLREQLANGTYPKDSLLPPQRQLAKDFGVSRDTIQRALAQLTADGLVEARQGSGTRVIGAPSSLPAPPQSERPGAASLGPLIGWAFQQTEVSVDVFTLTAETLLRHLKNQLELISTEGSSKPRTLRIRMLLPWSAEPLAYPRARNEGDPRVWERWQRMIRLNISELDQLKDSFIGLGVDTLIDIRRFPMTPQCKLYVLNDEHMLFGLYPTLWRKIPVPRADRPWQDENVDSLDVLGLGSILSYHRREADTKTHDSLFFTSTKDWFETSWENWHELLRSEGASTESSRED